MSDKASNKSKLTLICHLGYANLGSDTSQRSYGLYQCECGNKKAIRTSFVNAPDYHTHVIRSCGCAAIKNLFKKDWKIYTDRAEKAFIDAGLMSVIVVDGIKQYQYHQKNMKQKKEKRVKSNAWK